MQLTMFDDIITYKEHKKYLDRVFYTKQELIKNHQEQGRTKLYHILSFGAGTQSGVLLDMHFKGLIHYDAIIFADTGAEPAFIHEQVTWWKKRQQEIGNTTPFITTQNVHFTEGIEEMLMKYIHTDYQRLQLPLYCNDIGENGEEEKKGLLRRTCTVDFKIVPVQQAARQIVYGELQIAKNKRLPSDVGFIMDIGFAVDEINRVSTYQSPQYKYIYLSYPLIESNMTVKQSIEYLEAYNLPLKRSRCYLCPFNCDDVTSGMDWEEIIKNEPLSFLKAIYFDDQIRTVKNKRIHSILYFHYSRQPLKNVYVTSYYKLKSQYSKAFQQWIDEWITKLELQVS